MRPDPQTLPKAGSVPELSTASAAEPPSDSFSDYPAILHNFLKKTLCVCVCMLCSSVCTCEDQRSMPDVSLNHSLFYLSSGCLRQGLPLSLELIVSTSLVGQQVLRICLFLTLSTEVKLCPTMSTRVSEIQTQVPICI